MGRGRTSEVIRLRKRIQLHQQSAAKELLRWSGAPLGLDENVAEAE